MYTLRSSSSLASLLALLRLSPRITCCVLLLLILVLSCAELYGRVTRRTARRTQDAVAELGRVSSEALQLLRSVRALGAEQRHLRLFREQNERIKGIQSKRGVVLGVFEAASNGLAVLLQLVSLGGLLDEVLEGFSAGFRQISWRFGGISVGSQ